MENIDNFGVSTYFDGASQGNPLIGGVGGIIFLTYSHSLIFKVSLSKGTNNYVELMVLKSTFSRLVEHGVSKLQISGDS